MGHVQKRTTDSGTVWKARYRGPDRKERSKTFGRKIDAQRWLDVMEASKHRGDWVDPAGGQVTFGEWAERVESARQRRPSTAARDAMLLRRHVLPMFEDVPVGRIDTTSIETWIADLVASGLGADSIRKSYGLLRYSLQHAARRHLIVASPCTDDIVLPTLPARQMRFLSPEEVEALADAVGDRWRTMVLTAAYTGLRFGELTGLRRDRVDLLRRTVRVDGQIVEVAGALVDGPPKTRASQRTVTVPTSIAAELERHLAACPMDADGLVFAAPGGGPVRRTNWRRRTWVPAVRASVGEPCRFHDLRHTHAALLIAGGAHPKVIQQRLGHGSIAVTLDVYGHLFDGLDADAADAIDEARAAALAACTRPAGLVVPLR